MEVMAIGISRGNDIFCSICNLNMLSDKNCCHWPGKFYMIDTENDIECVDIKWKTKKIKMTSNLEETGN